MTLRPAVPAALLAALAAAATAGGPDRPDWSDVSRVFAENCLNCHATHGAAKGLRLDSYAAALAGGVDGPVLLAGDPRGSELIRRLRGESPPRMPFLGPPLLEDDIALIERWIASGLPDSRP